MAGFSARGSIRQNDRRHQARISFPIDDNFSGEALANNPRATFLVGQEEVRAGQGWKRAWDTLPIHLVADKTIPEIQLLPALDLIGRGGTGGVRACRILPRSAPDARDPSEERAVRYRRQAAGHGFLEP